ncbi:MAG: hypothetical protein PHT44_03590 [Candidatus Portnoybacteria bacterium]|nr:hypothetical protein [Candidatus Portnoybacteria bacterium]MDD4983090.1 hypothetical protein [Candidatus Portnoybacteria bacterium]
MSIIDFNRIGDWLKRNQADIAIAAGFILVAIIAFGSGRLSAPQIVRNPVIIDEPDSSSSANILSNVSRPIIGAAGESASMAGAKGLFVASKNGTKYYWPWCSWAGRIKEENKVWFNSEKDAQAAGFSPGACITSEAPAGYAKP